MSDEKKHKSGFALLKEKLAKAEAEKAKLQEQLAQALSERNNYSAQLDRAKTEIHNLKIDCNGKQSTIEKQATKISQQAKELNDAVGEIYNTTRQRDEAIRRMGALRRWWYGYKYPHSASDGNVELK